VGKGKSVNVTGTHESGLQVKTYVDVKKKHKVKVGAGSLKDHSR